MQLSDYGLGGLYEWASLVLLQVMPDEFFDRTSCSCTSLPPLGYLLITTSEEGRDPDLLKLVGGKSDLALDPTPAHTARREAIEESGLKLPLEAFEYQAKWLGFSRVFYTQHWKLLFRARCSMQDARWVSNSFTGREGETPHYLSIVDFYERRRQGRLKEDHYLKLVEYGLILPGGRDNLSAAAL